MQGKGGYTDITTCRNGSQEQAGSWTHVLTNGVRGKGAGQTSPCFSSAFVPLVSCSSDSASAVFCSLVFSCDHGAYTRRRRSSLACVCGQYVCTAYMCSSRVCTVFSLCADVLHASAGRVIALILRFGGAVHLAPHDSA
eukprot:scaffold52630_cov55-Phaeocystis_antarctica.AAC.2